ncbi:MGMT family protein [Amphritea sp.]|uniref:MGMT family protein n=1 Tax=Amphritea sp. TaxID=1872502 RepID=UPI0025BF482B|nr:MGMT family protein [Amphritea sp.]
MAQNPAYEMIWQVVGAIPSGKVATYGQIAELAGIPGGARMVGRCLSQLPRDSRLPWFRVVNASGKISLPVDSEGYQKQLALLQEDGVVVLNGRIRLAKFRW